MRRLAILALAIPLAACAGGEAGAPGVTRGETLLSVSASGQAESRPDRAEFQAGVETIAASARAASSANAEKIEEIVAALRRLGVAERDIQTRSVGLNRITYGPRNGQFQASNVIEVTMRDPAKAGEAVTAVSEAGANILSGPSLSMTDPEATANLAYADAYKAARARAEAYAKAAGMKVARVLYIRDAGGKQGDTYLAGAVAMETAQVDAMAPPPVAAPPPPPDERNAGMMVGTTRSTVTIQVDFALTET